MNSKICKCGVNAPRKKDGSQCVRIMTIEQCFKTDPDWSEGFSVRFTLWPEVPFEPVKNHLNWGLGRFSVNLAVQPSQLNF